MSLENYIEKSKKNYQITQNYIQGVSNLKKYWHYSYYHWVRDDWLLNKHQNI